MPPVRRWGGRFKINIAEAGLDSPAFHRFHQPVIPAVEGAVGTGSAGTLHHDTTGINWFGTMKIKMDFRVITVDQFRKRREFRHLFRIFQRHLRQLPERAAIAGVEIDAGGMGFVEKEPFRIHHRHNQQQMLFQYPGRLRIVAGEKFDQPEGAGGTGFFGTAVKAGDQHDIFFIVRYRGVGRADEKQRITGVIFGKSFDLQVRRPFFIIAQQRFKLLRFQPGMVADIPPVGIVFQFRRPVVSGFFPRLRLLGEISSHRAAAGARRGG